MNIDVQGFELSLPLPSKWTASVDTLGNSVTLTDGRVTVVFTYETYGSIGTTQGVYLNRFARVKGPGYNRRMLSSNVLYELSCLRWPPFRS